MVMGWPAIRRSIVVSSIPLHVGQRTDTSS